MFLPMTEMKCIIKQRLRREVFLFESLISGNLKDFMMPLSTGLAVQRQMGEMRDSLSLRNNAAEASVAQKRDRLEMWWNINTVINEFLIRIACDSWR